MNIDPRETDAISAFEQALIDCDRPIPDRRPYISRPFWDTFVPTLIGYVVFTYLVFNVYLPVLTQIWQLIF